MRRTRKNLLCRAGILSVAGLVASFTQNPLDAATVTWNNAAGGNWSGANWTGGVGTNPPQPADTARFALASSYTVTLDVNPTVTSTLLAGSNVTIANSVVGRTYTNTSTMFVNTGSTFNLTAATPVAWNVSNNSGFNANVNVSNGNDYSALNLSIGAAGSSTTTVSGSGSTLASNGGFNIGPTNGFTAALIFTSGAGGSTTSGATTIGNTPGATGSLTLQSGSSGTFNQIQVASTITAAGTGTFTITGGGTTMLTGGVGPLTVGSPASGSGTANFSSGSVSTLNSGMTVNATGTTNVQSGATITSSTVDLTCNGSNGGKIFVDGTGSSFTISGGLSPLTLGSVAAAGGIARLEVTNGGTFSTGTSTSNAVNRGALYVTSGTFNLNGNMTVNGSMGGYVQKDAAGTLNIASGKTLTLNAAQMLINGGYSMSSGSTIAVNNAGSSFDTTGTLTIANGSQLNLTNGNGSAQDVVIGGSGNGTVTHAGGLFSINGLSAKLLLGHVAGSTGTYNLSAGTLNYTNNVAGSVGEAIGFNGTGNFNQTGGTHTSGGTNATLIIGYASTAVGTYTISNGSLFTGALYLGRDPGGAQGTLTVNTGGMVLLNNEFLDLGLGVGSTGTVNANAGQIFTKGIFVGGVSTQARGTGVLNIAGGAVTADVYGVLTNSGQVRVWDTAGSAINLSAGSLTCDTLITSGNPTRFNWTGGTLNITGPSGFAVGAGGPLGSSISVGASQDLTTTNSLGISSGGTITVAGGDVSAASVIDNGTLNVSSGTVTTPLLAAGNDGTLSGGSGTGNVFLTGGTVFADTVRLGSSVGGIGNLTISGVALLDCDRLATNALTVNGGSVLVSTPAIPSDPVTDGSIVAGYIHDGAFTVTGGTVTTPKIKLGPTAGKTGTYNQSGGTVNVTTFGVGNDGTISGGLGVGNATISAGTLNVTNLLIGSSAGGNGVMTLTPGGNKTLKTATIEIVDPSGTSRLDLSDNKLIVTTTPVGTWNGGGYTGVTGLIQFGRGDGSWNGGGIRTSMTDATTGVLTTLAVARADETGHDGGIFGGVSVSGDDVLVMYTWGGDADLNGELNGDDYFYIDSNILANQAGANNASFHNGDFDYSGAIDGDDYFILDSNILQAQASAPFPTGAGATGLSAIPEPASVMALLALALPLSRKRRR